MLNNAIDGSEALTRPIKTFKQLCLPGWELDSPDEKVLLEPREFMKLFKHLHGTELPRRTLQLYSSPQFKLLPPPLHKGGHISYYANPEHTQRLAVILHLRDKLRLSLKSIRKVLESYPAEHYHLILYGVLTGEELLDFPAFIQEGFNLKDVVFHKVTWLLTAMDKGYWDMVHDVGRPAPQHIERSVNSGLLKDLKDLGGWLRTDCRMNMDQLISAERQRRHFEEKDSG